MFCIDELLRALALVTDFRRAARFVQANVSKRAQQRFRLFRSASRSSFERRQNARSGHVRNRSKLLTWFRLTHERLFLWRRRGGDDAARVFLFRLLGEGDCFWFRLFLWFEAVAGTGDGDGP